MTNLNCTSSDQMVLSTNISSLKNTSLSRSRKRVRKHRVALLREYVSVICKQNRRVNDLAKQPRDLKRSVRKSGKSSTNIKNRYLQKGQTTPATSQTVRAAAGIMIRAHRTSICKGFTNTLMRNGERLRYQSILRRSLLLL